MVEHVIQHDDETHVFDYDIIDVFIINIHDACLEYLSLGMSAKLGRKKIKG